MNDHEFQRLRQQLNGGDIFAVRQYLDAGGDPNQCSKYNEPILIIAASAGRTPIVELLLEAGACVNSPNKFGHTALLYAALNGHERTVKVLLERGADPSIKASGSSIKGWLVHYGKARAGIVELLESWQAPQEG